MIVEDTLVLMKDATINMEHIYREGTSLSYYLANHAFEVEGRQLYNTFRELPSQGRKVLNLDKLEVPNLRIKSKIIR